MNKVTKITNNIQSDYFLSKKIRTHFETLKMLTVY